MSCRDAHAEDDLLFDERAINAVHERLLQQGGERRLLALQLLAGEQVVQLVAQRADRFRFCLLARLKPLQLEPLLLRTLTKLLGRLFVHAHMIASSKTALLIVSPSRVPRIFKSLGRQPLTSTRSRPMWLGPREARATIVRSQPSKLGRDERQPLSCLLWRPWHVTYERERHAVRRGRVERRRSRIMRASAPIHFGPWRGVSRPI